MESMEAVRLMKKSGAKCILDCVQKVTEAELSASRTAVEPGVDGESAVVKANIQGNANGKIESIKANEAVPPPKPLANAVILPPSNFLPLASAVYASMFVGGISSAMKDVDLQNLFDTKAIIGRFYRKKFGKVAGFAKVLIPIDEVDQALSQDFSLSGSKLRVARWDKPLLPAPTMLQAASSATRRIGRRNRSRKMPSAVTASVSNGLIKERACFVAEFFAAQAVKLLLEMLL